MRTLTSVTPLLKSEAQNPRRTGTVLRDHGPLAPLLRACKHPTSTTRAADAPHGCEADEVVMPVVCSTELLPRPPSTPPAQHRDTARRPTAGGPCGACRRPFLSRSNPARRRVARIVQPTATRAAAFISASSAPLRLRGTCDDLPSALR
jgi:hypothetical protein